MQTAIPPPPSGHRLRTRVVRVVDAAAEASRVLVVTGPAGAGKTVALADWAGRSDIREQVVWITLDDDPDAGHSWRAIVDALGRLDPTITIAGPAQIAAVLNRLRRPVCLIVDDVHFADATSEDRLLRLASQLRQGHVVLATRRTAGWGSELHRVQIPVATVGTDQLALTEDEVADIAVALGVDVQPRTVLAATGGHPLLTRLILAVPGPDPTGAAGRLAADWCRTLVEPEQLRFALVIAQSPVVDDALAAAMSDIGTADSVTAADLLDELARRGLGVRDHHGDFRYHPVVGSALRQHGQGTLDATTLDRSRSVAIDGLSTEPRHALAVLRLLVHSGRWSELWPHAARNAADVLAHPQDARRLVDAVPDAVSAADGTVGALVVMVRSADQTL